MAFNLANDANAKKLWNSSVQGLDFSFGPGQTVPKNTPVQGPIQTSKSPNSTSTAPTTIPASDIGTPAPSVPVAKINTDIQNQLSLAMSQAQSLQNALDEMKVQKAEQQIAAPSSGDLRRMMAEQAMGMMSGGFQLSDEAQQLRTDAAEKQLALRNLETQMQLYNKDTKDTVYQMLQNPEGKTQKGLQAQVSNYEYERYARPGGAADQAIEAQFALNNAQFAYELANNAYTVEKEQYNTQLDYFKTMYTMLGDDMTESEAAQYNSQLRMYELETSRFMDSKQTALERAQANGAPADVIKAIRAAENETDVWTAAGQYSVDPSLQLARDKFAWDVYYAKQKMAMDAALSAGQTSLMEYNKIMETNAVKKEIGKSKQAIDRIKANTLGFKATTGKVKGRLAGMFEADPNELGLGGKISTLLGPLGITTTAFFGATEARQRQEDVANDMDYIEAALTTQRIGFAKALGLTGAMSDKDIELIGKSADTLVAAWDSESMTFRGSPEEIERAFNDLSVALNENEANLNLDPEYQAAVLTEESASDISSIFNE